MSLQKLLDDSLSRKEIADKKFIASALERFADDFEIIDKIRSSINSCSIEDARYLLSYECAFEIVQDAMIGWCESDMPQFANLRNRFEGSLALILSHKYDANLCRDSHQGYHDFHQRLLYADQPERFKRLSDLILDEQK